MAIQKVLLVDDSPADLGRLALGYLKVTIITARDGEDAVNVAHTQQPDLILWISSWRNWMDTMLAAR